VLKRRDLKDCRVLVTGASSGIGAALARQLHRLGTRLLLTARREDRLLELAARCQSEFAAGHAPLVVSGDLTKADTRERLCAEVTTQWRQLDLLINNAGCGAVGSFADAAEPRLRMIMEVNFFAPVELTRLCLPLLRQ
jgi:short-subunit dehydrogenase